jgi:RimJ/RimL family protein N-acetyltransferase
MIETINLRLVPCEPAHLEAIIEDPKSLGPLLGVAIPGGWPHFPEAMPHAYASLKADPSLRAWGFLLFVHVAECVLVGSGGFKGRPDASGAVEVGYEVAPGYRMRGFATEASKGMIDYAFSHPHVTSVLAHTLPDENPSTRVLKRAGMKFVGVFEDPEDGEVWRWRIGRDEFAPLRCMEKKFASGEEKG